MANLKDFSSISTEKGIKLVHLNIRSIIKKIDQLRVILATSNIEILTISETWLQIAHPTESISISGYTCYRQDRVVTQNKTKGGGLITYIKDCLADQAITLSKLNSCSPHLEAQWIKIEREHASNLILCNLYRPPNGDLSKALDHLNQCLPSINTAKCDLFILGDWNVNYKNTLSPNYKKLVFFENCNNLRQIIKETTRNTDKSKTLIDLILTNTNDIAASGTLNAFISDHQPIFVIKKKVRTKPNRVSFEGRSYKNLNLDLLLTNLREQDWENFFTLTDPEQAWLALQKEITEELDKQCPVRKSTIRHYVPDWIGPELKELTKDRDYFYKKAKLTNSVDDWNIAKHLRNVANSGIRKAKADFVQRKLSEFAKDGSKFWRELKQIYPSAKSKANKGKIQLICGKTKRPIPESETASYINDYFVNVGNFTTANKATNPNSTPAKNTNTKRGKRNKRTNRRSSQSTTYQAQLQSHSQPPWSLTDFTEDEVIEVIKTIEPTKSSGLLNINNNTLKSILKILAAQITQIFNVSIRTGSFPTSWKNALVIPIHKKGDLSSVSNYRPISLLPQPGKLLEKLVHNRLTDYIEHNELLSNKQHGFRKHKSTLDALHQLTSQINVNMDKRLPTLVTFIDFKKAFDCVQHDLLIAKIKLLNLDDITIKWLEDYLMQREQRVLANNVQSQSLQITQGVPQGSIIGPLMYIIYANNITRIFKGCEVALYADDTVLYTKCKSWKTALRDMQVSLNALAKWCKLNGIFVNCCKTKYMLFGSKVTLAKCKDREIKLAIDNEPIARARNYSYLGVTLDEQLNYELHAQGIFRKVKNKLIQLRAMRYFLTRKAALLVYKNMILPILEYGDIFLSSLSKITKKKLQTLQNKALRIALNDRGADNTDGLHQQAKILKLTKRRKMHCLQFIFKKKNNNALLTKKSVGRQTRSSYKVTFMLRKPSSEKYKSCLSYSGFRAWNQLPASIQTIDDSHCFKHRIKQLFSQEAERT